MHVPSAIARETCRCRGVVLYENYSRNNWSNTLRVILETPGSVPLASTCAQSVVLAVNTVPFRVYMPIVAAWMPQPEGCPARKGSSCQSGLRTPTASARNAVNERDELGSDLVPDFMILVKEGGFYGWPYSYFGQYVDTRVQPPRPDLVAKATVPDYALGAHTASLGLAFYEGALLPKHYAGGAFVGQHGSWNRNPPSGYRVMFVPFADGRTGRGAGVRADGFSRRRG